MTGFLRIKLVDWPLLRRPFAAAFAVLAVGLAASVLAVFFVFPLLGVVSVLLWVAVSLIRSSSAACMPRDHNKPWVRQHIKGISINSKAMVKR